VEGGCWLLVVFLVLVELLLGVKVGGFGFALGSLDSCGMVFLVVGCDSGWF